MGKFNGITLPCPCCGEAESEIAVNLYTEDGERFFCGSCQGNFGPELIEAIIRKWVPVLKWVSQFPAKEVEKIQAEMDAEKCEAASV